MVICILILLTPLVVKIANFLKFNMADGRHIGNRENCNISVTLSQGATSEVVLCTSVSSVMSTKQVMKQFATAY